jgi:acetylornithine deacetylase/succinyl-diaminopimelate desuccinylase-like protein
MKVENILSDLIKIQSINPPGGETAVALYLKKLFDEYKIPNEIIEGEPGRGNFIATLGEGKKSLLFLSHLDVVPVSDGWAFPPFSGDVREGFVYGRGALDCKGLVAAEAHAVLTLAQSGKLNGKLIFAPVADEEVGGYLGAGYLVEHYPEKIRADFAVNEGAEAPVTVNGKACHFISVGEKSPSWLRLRTKGIAGHGSTPYLLHNAVAKMAKIIDGLSEYRPEIVLTPEVSFLIGEIASLTGYSGKIDEKTLDKFLSKLEDSTLAANLRALTRMTVSPNVVQGGIKTNIVPDSCTAEIDIRILPGQDKNYVLKELKPIFGNAEIETIQYSLPTISSGSSAAYKLIVNTLHEFLGDTPVLPSLCTGATDSRYLREMGVPAYGIGMMTYKADAAMKASVHGKNEKLDIKSLQLKSDFLVRLAQKYLG